MQAFNALDWYWIVGGTGPHTNETGKFTGDDSRVFCSARNQYVPADDPDYQAWKGVERQAGSGYFDPTTRIDTEANLADVLAPYGITANFT